MIQNNYSNVEVLNTVIISLKSASKTVQLGKTPQRSQTMKYKPLF